MKKTSLLAIFFVLIFSFNKKANATHYMGADFTFECVSCDSIGGACEYLVRLVIYRDCNGATLAGTHSVSYSESDCPGWGGTITLNRVSITDITPLCPGESSACGGSGVYGIERHEFTATILLPYGCGDNWVFNAGPYSARNSAITTLTTPGSLYITATLDNTVVPCNNVAKFDEYPTAFACVDQKTFYNHGARDIDGDSLSYKLVDCYNSDGVAVPYKDTLEAELPLYITPGTEFKIDPRSGNISFTPAVEQVGVICVEVTEWRDGVAISTTVRDMQYTVIECDNEIPTLTGIDSTVGVDEVTEIGVCPGQEVDFKIFANDADLSDTISMYWNYGISGGTFTVVDTVGTPDRPCGRFQWTPTTSDIGVHSFLVTVADNACPIIGSLVKAYIIDVRPPVFDVFNDTTVCQGDPVIPMTSSTVTFDTFSWDPPIGVSDPHAENPTLTPTTTTTYKVFAGNGYCSDEDEITITIMPDPVVDAGDPQTVICIGDTLNLTATHDGDIIEWITTGETTETITVVPTTSTMYVVKSTNSIGCTSYDSVLVTVYDLPTVYTGDDEQICLDESITITGTVGTSVSSFDWSPNIGSTLTVTVNPDTTTIYTLTAIDTNGCVNVDEILVVVNPNPEPVYDDTTIYKGETIPLSVIGGCLPTQSVLWKNLDGTLANDYLICPPYDPFCTNPAATENPTIVTEEDHTFIIEYLDCNGCPGVDTFHVRVIPEAILETPNAFTPDNDGINDEFYPIVRGPGVIEEFKVFNRWGQLVYETNVVNDGWDGTINGTPQEMGTYVWILSYKTTPNTTEVFFESGNVTLLR